MVAGYSKQFLSTGKIGSGMKKIINQLLTFAIFICISFAQTSSPLEMLEVEESQTPILYREYNAKVLPLEDVIDPDKYILGPGDRLRISISTGVYEERISKEWSSENIDNFVTVDPIGNIFLPKIGNLKAKGKSISILMNEINTLLIEGVYKEGIVALNLVRMRQFKVLVYGGVNKPGFVTVSPISRLTEAVNRAGGVHKYGHSENVELIRDGENSTFHIKEFLVNGVLEQNPQLEIGDKIFIPFIMISNDDRYDITEYNNSKIIVTGFVYRPKALNYSPGYKVRDYIALSGGVLDIGSKMRVKIIRPNGEKINFAYNKNVEPGDIIEVPETVNSQMFGNLGLIQSITSIATLILAYQATLN